MLSNNPKENNINTKEYQILHPHFDTLAALNKGLGINIMDQLARKLQLFVEEQYCVDAGIDYYKRSAKLHPDALSAWQAMAQQAHGDGVQLYICSAFRSYQYQADLIQRKLDKGLDVNHIITILAPPGFSEHHTGRAVDIITADMQELNQNFENTDAFAWLRKNAKNFNFKMSYPKDNPTGIIYEPWHWCYQI